MTCCFVDSVEKYDNKGDLLSVKLSVESETCARSPDDDHDLSTNHKLINYLEGLIKKPVFLLLFLGKYVEDSNYTYWLYMTVYYPLVATFLLPTVFVILIYFSSVTLYIFKFHRWFTFDSRRELFLILALIAVFGFLLGGCCWRRFKLTMLIFGRLQLNSLRRSGMHMQRWVTMLATM